MSNDDFHCDDFTLLQCGRDVPTWRYVSLRDHVCMRAVELAPCKPYTLRMICGEQYWYDLGGFKTFAGIIMAELVELGLVPYHFASDRDARPLWYGLSP